MIGWVGYSHIRAPRWDSRLVLSNFLQFYLRGRSGLVFYRGLELAQSARSLTLIAQYARFTGDTALPLAYFKKMCAAPQTAMNWRLRQALASACRLAMP